MDDLTTDSGLEVNRQAFLMAIAGFKVKIGTGRIDLETPDRRHPTAWIAASGLFDFDHLCAQIGHHRGGGRTELPDRPIHHSDSLQWFVHRLVPSSRVEIACASF